MPKTIIKYSLEELCNENEHILLATKEGVEISIENTDKGLEIKSYVGNKIEMVEVGVNNIPMDVKVVIKPPKKRIKLDDIIDPSFIEEIDKVHDAISKANEAIKKLCQRSKAWQEKN